MTVVTLNSSHITTQVAERVLVGVDDSPQAHEAARQAGVLRTVGGELRLVAVVDSGRAARASFDSAAIANQMMHAARKALEVATARTQATSNALYEGRPSTVLLDCGRRHSTTLLALGAPAHRHGASLPLGAVGNTLLRHAPCSVLLSRPASWSADGPQHIVVGVDGSPEATRAADVARALCERFGAQLTVLVGLGGKLRDPEAVKTLFADALVDQRPPVDALVAASRSADLLIVGSRGLHGLQALGSVSERVAARAGSSVLVIRDHRDASSNPDTRRRR